MQLLLVRHAIAQEREDFAPTGLPDSERPLTEEGIRKMRENARGIMRLVPRLGMIATSPYVRARVTAGILLEAYGAVPYAEIEAMTPGGSREDVVAWLRKHADRDPIALVGHEPDIGELAAWLISGRTSDGGITFRKGGAALIEFEGEPTAGEGRLEWLLPPRVLKR